MRYVNDYVLLYGYVMGNAFMFYYMVSGYVLLYG